MEVLFKRLNDLATEPTKATEGSAAFDLHAAISSPYPLSSGGTAVIPTGISIQLKPYHAALILPRSGLACKEAITVANSPGLIDSDYRGEILVYLRSHRPATLSGPFLIEPNMRIAQLLVIGLPAAIMREVTQLDSTSRGSNGFGSTGR